MQLAFSSQSLTSATGRYSPSARPDVLSTLLMLSPEKPPGRLTGCLCLQHYLCQAQCEIVSRSLLITALQVSFYTHHVLQLCRSHHWGTSRGSPSA